MKKILFVMHGLSDGGAEKVASILANYLANHNYAVRFLCMTAKNIDYNTDLKIDVRIYEQTSKTIIGKFLKKNRFVEKNIKEFKPDVIISFLYYELVFSCLRRRKIVTSIRNDPSRTDVSFFQRKIRHFVLKRANAIVFQTEAAKQYFEKKISDKGFVIPNPLLVPNNIKWKGFNCSKNFVTLCRLNKQKNIPLMIESFSEVHKRHQEFELHIYGVGEEKENLQKIISDKKLESCIKLKGRTNNPFGVLSTSFAFCLTSDYEGVSNAMLEACALGVPCLCTDCPPGGAREYIFNGENGFLTEVGNKEDLETKMEELITKQSLTKLDYHSERVRTIHNYNQVCKQWEEVLLNACKNRNN